jgi:hypothetical protein
MFKRLALLAVVLTTVNAQANDKAELEKYLTISSVTATVETTTDKGTFTSVLEEEVSEGLRLADLQGLPSENGTVDKANIGEVIQIANDLIALGERVYEIVKKGKPVLNMDYAPMSILPKDGTGRAVDMFETENWSRPVAAKVRMAFKNGFGSEVVTFNYTIVYSHSGSYEGRGAYLTALQVIPSNVNVSWGFSLNVAMKLVGLQNHGSRANPVAGAVIGVNYRVESVLKTIETTDTYHVTGRGALTQL